MDITRLMFQIVPPSVQLPIFCVSTAPEGYEYMSHSSGPYFTNKLNAVWDFTHKHLIR